MSNSIASFLLLCLLYVICQASSQHYIPGNVTYLLRSDKFAITHSLPDLVGFTDFGYAYNHGVGPAAETYIDLLLEDGSVVSIRHVIASYFSGSWKTYEVESPIVEANLTTTTLNLDSIPSNIEFRWSVYSFLYAGIDDEPQSAFKDKKNLYLPHWPVLCAVTLEVPNPTVAGTMEVRYSFNEFPNLLNTWIVESTFHPAIDNFEAVVVGPNGEMNPMNVTIYNAFSQSWDSGRFFAVLFKSHDGQYKEVVQVMHDQRDQRCNTSGVLPTLELGLDQAVEAACEVDYDQDSDVTGLLIGVMLIWGSLAYLLRRKIRKKRLQNNAHKSAILLEERTPLSAFMTDDTTTSYN